MLRPPAPFAYLTGKLCRPEPGATEVERLRSDRTWVPDDGRPGLAFSGLLPNPPCEIPTPMAWAPRFNAYDDANDPGEIAMARTCWRFSAANGREAPEAGLEAGPAPEAPKTRRAKASPVVVRHRLAGGLAGEPVAYDDGKRRVVVPIDPSEACTGLGAWEMGVGPIALTTVRLTRAGYTQADSIATLDALIGDAEWVAVCERPPPTKFGFRQAPVAAYRHWLDAITLLARQRCARAGVRYRAPLILKPDPNLWRRDSGLPTRGRGESRAAKRDNLKANSIALAKRILAETPGRLGTTVVDGQPFDLVALGDDAAEALILGAWGATELRQGQVLVGRKVVDVRWSV